MTILARSYLIKEYGPPVYFQTVALQWQAVIIVVTCYDHHFQCVHIVYLREHYPVEIHALRQCLQMSVNIQFETEHWWFAC